MLAADMVPRAINPALEQAEKRFTMIDSRNRAVWIVAAVFVPSVGNMVVTFPSLQRIAIGQMLVSVHNGVFAHDFIQDLAEILLGDVAHNPRLHIAPALNQGNHGSLANRNCALIAFAAHIRLVHLRTLDLLSAFGSSL